MESLVRSFSGASVEVFIPPTSDERYILGGPGAGLEEKKLIPRLMTLIYILQHDLGLGLREFSGDNDRNITIVRGSVNDNMVRKYPYYRVLIKSLNRLVYVCEEEGNVTIVFDKSKVLQCEGVETVETLDTMNKSKQKELISKSPEVGRVVRQNLNWRSVMLEFLTTDFSSETLKGREKKVVKQKTDFESYPKKKEGWENVGSLTGKCYAAKRSIKTFADQFRKSNPEWFEVQRFGTRISEHYHPDLVAKIKSKFPLKVVSKVDK